MSYFLGYIFLVFSHIISILRGVFFKILSIVLIESGVLIMYQKKFTESVSDSKIEKISVTFQKLPKPNSFFHIYIENVSKGERPLNMSNEFSFFVNALCWCYPF